MLSNCIYNFPLCLLATGEVVSFIRAWAQISLSYPPSLSLLDGGDMFWRWSMTSATCNIYIVYIELSVLVIC